MPKITTRYKVVLKEEPSGGLTAIVPEFPELGEIDVTGKDHKQAVAVASTAIDGAIAERERQGAPIPQGSAGHAHAGGELLSPGVGGAVEQKQDQAKYYQWSWKDRNLLFRVRPKPDGGFVADVGPNAFVGGFEASGTDAQLAVQNLARLVILAHEKPAAFNYNLMTVGSILVSAVTLFGSLQVWLTLSPWADWLVDQWQQVTGFFWNSAAGPVGVHLPRPLVEACNMGSGMIMLGIGTRKWRLSQQDLEHTGVKYIIYLTLLLAIFCLTRVPNVFMRNIDHILNNGLSIFILFASYYVGGIISSAGSNWQYSYDLWEVGHKKMNDRARVVLSLVVLLVALNEATKWIRLLT